MAQPVIQTAFHAGEWAPQLYARVDLQKYHSAAALLRNFFVDYRGGASTRPGTKYCLQAFKSSGNVRLIPFQASFSVNYVLEFGDFYIRFFFNGSPVLETGFAINGATKANPCVVSTTTTHGMSVGDWVYITGVNGMTQLNGRYFVILATPTTSSMSLGKILDGSNVNSLGYGAWTSGGTVSRIYTIPSPYAQADLPLLKYAQNVNTLVICHPSYSPSVLTLITATNWTIAPITFGSHVASPTGVAAATSSAGAFNYSYVVTALDADNEESAPSSIVSTTINAAGATATISWSAMPGASSYNVYSTGASQAGVVPSGSAFGFVTNVTGTSATISYGPNGVAVNWPPDFTQTPPIATNPFAGAGVQSITVTASGTYTTPPGVTIGASPAGVTATAQASLGAISITGIVNGGSGYIVNQIVAMGTAIGGAPVMTVKVLTVSGGAVTSAAIAFAGSIVVGNTPTNPVGDVANPFSSPSSGLQINLTWGVTSVIVNQPGTGYSTAPSVTFSSGTAAATAVLASASAGNPSVPGYFDQRLFLGGLAHSPGQFNMSIPGSYFNFNISDPLLASDAIEATLVSNQLNSIKSMVGMSSGMVLFTDRQAWLINGGSPGAPVSAVNIAANSQAYEGISDIPPIVINYDVLYVQAKGSIVRDLTFNFYTQIYTGTDVSVLSSHLFYGFNISYWAFSEEPFKVVWAIRSDGKALSLTFLKEQEIIGWAHHDTTGLFKCVTSVTETVTLSNNTTTSIDATYFVVQRTVNGQSVQYIERLAEREFNGQVKNAWCVDAAVQHNGSPTTTFSGFDHLVGQSLTGLADGVPPSGAGGGAIIVSSDGNVTLNTAASLVTLGLPFTPQLQSLRLDLGEPTVQGKRKKVTALTVRVMEALGLSCGRTFSTLVPMKDLVVGNIGTMSNQVVTDLVTDDARTEVDPLWDVPGQICIQQSQPMPATILGIIPEVTIGDTPK